MADRYWVGGSGNWDAATTTNWSTTSGGSGGASAPTYLDNVIFDSNSSATNYTVTLTQGGFFTGSISGTTLTVGGWNGNALGVGQSVNTRSGAPNAGGTYITSFGTGTGGNGTYNVSVSQTVSSVASGAMPSCADLTVTTQAAGVTLTLAGAGQVRFSVYGSISLPASGVSLGFTSELILCSDTTGKTVFTNGATVSGSVRFDRDNGGWTLSSALTTGGSVTVNRGSFDTGNFALTATGISSSTGLVRTINLGSSAITLSSTTPITLDATNLSFNAGTSTITLSNAGPTFAGGSNTFYNVTFSSTTAGGKTFSGTNIFNNLTFSTRTATGFETISFAGNQTISGTLTLSSPSTVMIRRALRSDVVGAQRTISVGTAAAFSSVDLRDIAITGAASPISGTSFGDAGNNSGATFTSAKTVYWNLVAGGSWTATAWATTSGGTPAVANFPLAQDTIIIQNTGLNTSATITATSAFVGTLDFSTRTNAMTFTVNTGTAQFFGPVTLNAAVTVAGTVGLRTGTFSDTYNIPVSSLAQVVVTVTANGSLAITGTAVNTPFRYVLSADGVLSGVPVVGGPTRADVYNFLSGLITTGQSEVNAIRLQLIYNLLLNAILTGASKVEEESITLGIYVNTNYRMERLDYLPQELPRIDLVIE